MAARNKHEFDPLEINLFVLILIIVALIGFLFVLPAKGEYVPIPRNQAWDDLVLALRAQFPSMQRIQSFLKRNEKYPRVKELDAQVLADIDEALKTNQRIANDLKKIRKEISNDYQGGAP
jgi:hypothetical protein